MKFLVFTDLHEDMSMLKILAKKSKDVDHILCCGDFTIFGHAMKKMLKELNNFNKPMYVIHGNHESATEVKSASKKLKNIHFVDEEVIHLGDLDIIGYGGGGFSKTFPGFSTFIKKVKKESKDAKVRILLTHAPPWKTKLDRIGKDHVGNESISKLIKTCKIDYAFSGHLHENEHVHDKIGKTQFINPGPDGEFLEINL